MAAASGESAGASADAASMDRVQKHVACLGGGQLGRMMAEAAHRLGIQFTCLDPAEDSPCGQVSGRQVQGSFRDPTKIQELVALKPDVLTVEIEHINVDAMSGAAAAAGVPVQPAPATLALVQDKYAQMKHFEGCPAVLLDPFAPVRAVADVVAAGDRWGWPVMLKNRRMAYDGKGNAPVANAGEAAAKVEQLGGVADGEALFVEKWVPFVRELAVMVARSVTGEVRSYPCVETKQRDSICHTVLVPAPSTHAVRQRARAAAEAAVSTLGGAGVFGVELFELADGRVLLNEVAPRPHNSGHYTIEACECDQFEQHLRCILGLPMGSTALRVGAAAMVNCLGTGTGAEAERETWALNARAMTTPGAVVHWYGKAGVRAGRKVGHVTVTATTPAELADRVAKIDPTAEVGARADPLVGIIMGSDSDLPAMRPAAAVLEEFGVPFEVTIVSAHRTPDRMLEYARAASGRGLRVIIAGAGGAAHLPGMVAALTPLPVVGVPVPLRHLDGVDSLHSIVQMPRGVPVATVAIGNSTNAALLAIRMLAVADPRLLQAMEQYQADMRAGVETKIDRLAEMGWKDYTKP